MNVEVTELKDDFTDILLPSATVTSWLIAPDGTTVPSSTIPLNMQAAGHYRGVSPYDLDLDPDVQYTCIIRADTGNPVQRGEWTIPVIAGARYG